MSKPHARIMGSGTSAVADTCTVEEILRAADAFDYLGLTELAGLRRLTDGDFDNGREQRRNHAFYGLEVSLHPAFERRYRLNPEDFDPIAGPAASGDFPLPTHGPVSCSGTIIVHESGKDCTLGADCARLLRGFLEHEGATLHRRFCPSGPDWAR
ncbi:hypothetical protein [Dactylosporangium darangshiense]|uniref:Uncharacterized protein n=1 Tax=Dactylosporangium darangshiense TaxID=579108 RepID=A0ABP8DIB7_9ACTN